MQAPLINPESDPIKNAFIATSVAMYLQACHLQHEEEADAVMLSFLLATANTGQPGNSSMGNNSTGGQAGNNGGDDDDSDNHNLGSGMVNNVGQVTDDSDIMGAGSIGRPRTKRPSADTDEEAATSPGGTGNSRIVGGINPEDDEIDWNDVTDEGTKDADAASS